MIINELFENAGRCPECGGISFSDLILAEKKDACYHKIKATAKVWPSAYASGRLVQCRKKGAANYGNKSEGVAEGSFGSGFNGPFTAVVTTGERPESRTKTKKFRREDDAILWSEDWFEDFPQYVYATIEVKDSNGDVVWQSDDELGVAEGEQVQVPTEDGITMQDIRLMAGEGKLTQKTIKQAIAVIRKQRADRSVSEACWAGYRKDGMKTMFGKRYPNCVKVKKTKEDIDEAGRVARKPGQPAGSKKHSDLYTDENPRGTITGLKFATAEDAKASVSKIRSSGRAHAHRIQAAVAMEQRARAAGKTEAAAVYRRYINSVKKADEGVAEARYDRDDYYNARQGPEYGRGMTASGASGDSSITRIDDIFKGQSKRLPADPFGRSLGDVPPGDKGRIYSTAEVDETRRGQVPMTLQPGETDNIEPENISGFRTLPAYKLGQAAQQKVGKQLIQKSPHTYQSDQDFAYRQGAFDAQQVAMFANFGKSKPLTTAEGALDDSDFGKSAALMTPSPQAAQQAKDIVQKQADANVIGQAKITGAVPVTREGEQQPGADYRDPREVNYDDDYDAMVARVKKLAGLGPMKTVYDPKRRVYRNMPTAVQPKK